MRLEINYMEKPWKRQTKYATNQPMNLWKKSKRKSKIPGGKWKWKHNDPESIGQNKSSYKSKVDSDTSQPQEPKTKTKQNSKLTEGKKSYRSHQK